MLPVSGCCQRSGSLSCLCWSPNDPSLKKSTLLAVAINAQQFSQLQKEHLYSCPPQAGHSTYNGASPCAQGGLGGKGSRRVLGLPLEPSLILNQGMQRGSGRSQGEITEVAGPRSPVLGLEAGLGLPSNRSLQGSEPLPT